nr:hypothetical protein [uncultured Sphaerochaeta sp.]
MRNKIPQYPMLNQKLIQEIGIKDNLLDITYETDDLKQYEQIAVSDSRLILLGEYEYWDPHKTVVTIERCITIANPQKLYGETGIIPDGAEVGIASEFLSSSSQQRYIFKNVTFLPQSQTGPLVIKQRLVLNKNTYRGIGEIVDFVYIARKTCQYRGRKANTNGAVLGYLSNPIKIAFDGVGSLFPALLADFGTNGPLWEMRFNSSDPPTDPFNEDYICILLNISHRRYKDLKITDFSRSNAFRNEVFSSWISLAYFIIHSEYREVFEDICTGNTEEFGKNSIAQWLYYFKTTFLVDLSKPEKWTASINTAVHKLLG